ncbi:PLP-dependent transferase [Schizopora paradoxa]|uniref:PLP-dependent transferase n=1 Tax=Schizopora paradoxa TaxID=27342 RepID=A0A0H2S8A5_9AGAM|nr:PLP-dependent transferase [Schizopora paradoxa]
MSPTLDIAKARSNFPALKDGFIFADNAGGSQCLQSVVDHISDYLLNTNCQLGADYSVSATSTKRVADGAVSAALLINAASPEEIAFGSSSTMHVENLARALENDILADEEIIITPEHESNCGPWKKLGARRGITVKLWAATQIPESPNNTYAVQLALDTLLPLVTSKTRLVAFTACSNILGSITDVAKVVSALREEAKKKGARKLEVCVDCVAYAPHRRIDVKAWDVDYCYFSFYKVYGPHIGMLYARKASLSNSITSLAHHFLKVDATSYKLQPGGPGYELPYSTTAVVPYLQSLSPSGDLDDAFALIAAHEQALLAPLLGYLTSPEARARGVCVVGNEKIDMNRVPTVSFVVAGDRKMASKDLVAVFDKKGGMGIRYGHFYAYTLIDSLQPKLDINDGIIRISLVHYNTVEEVETLVKELKEVLA